jgi:hypothetical protein
MSHPFLRWCALALALLLAAGCKDRHQPVKPTVAAAPLAAHA